MLIHSTVTSLSTDIDECTMQLSRDTNQEIPLPQTSSDSISSDSWANIADMGNNDDTLSFNTQSLKKKSQFSLFL